MMNQVVKMALHGIGLAMGAVVLMGLWNIFSAELAVALPVLKSGAFPNGSDLIAALKPAVAKAIGNFFETFSVVVGAYVIKLRTVGSSHKQINEETK